MVNSVIVKKKSYGDSLTASLTHSPEGSGSQVFLFKDHNVR